MSSKSPNKKHQSNRELMLQKRKELYKELVPLIKSFTLWIILVVIVAWDYTSHRWFSMLFIDLTTYLSYGLAKVMLLDTQILKAGSNMVTTLEVNYNSIQVNGYPMIIELECSAYHAYIALFTLVLFSSWKAKQKLSWGVLLFTALSVINALRIVLLGVIGKNAPKLFNVMHDYIWNILIVIIIWGLWEFSNRKLSHKAEH
jgi:exosortase/archaeosortase family protein